MSKEKVDEVLTRFTNDAAAQSLLVSDTSNYVRSVLKRAGRRQGGADRPHIAGRRCLGIESLKWMDPLSVAELLRNEHPQIVAAILVHLDPDHASGILGQFTERQRGEVMLRIATLGHTAHGAQDLNEVLFKAGRGDKMPRVRWAACRRRPASST